MDYLLIVAGLVCLFVGGEALVRGSASTARRLGVSPLLIGLTLVGFGTSAPELVTSVAAAFAGSPGIAVGNVVGSNIANILLILGLTAVIVPIVTSRDAILRDGLALCIATAACLGIVLVGFADRPYGIGLILLLGLYLTYTISRERRVQDAAYDLHRAESEIAEPGPERLSVAIGLAFFGLVLTLVGAKMLVSGAIDLAESAGLSQTLIGLTIVAVGTSLPELSASIVAAVRRQTDLALGNILGSNLFNTLGILGVTAIVHPLEIPVEIARIDIWVMIAATLAMLGFALTGGRLCRLEGGALLVGYAAYLGWTCRSIFTA
ncbi:MAG: calcium/sodium antiporter [Alphaproteobacteria bacterium]|nr:calcium/sodium antiporter [Alphaproteobacteria bacterium]